MARKHRLVDCNPKWHGRAFITFDCPEGHVDCRFTIPFTPTLDGVAHDHPRPWERQGDTFETLTLTPSIKCNSKYSSREEVLADPKILPEYVTESMWCKLHIQIGNGAITFCPDSK
jgi:hypothetical protein